MSMALTIAAAFLAAVILIFIAFRVSLHVTDAKTNDELAARMPDGSHTNHDSSNGMWDGGAGGGGD